jgi:hypothetical protein
MISCELFQQPALGARGTVQALEIGPTLLASDLQLQVSAASFYRLLSASDVPATDWARSRANLVAWPDRARSVVRQYEDSCVNAARLPAAQQPAVDWALGGRRLPSSSAHPDRMTSGKRAAAGGRPAERCHSGCRSRVRSGPAPRAVPEADGILRFSRTSLASISASGAEARARCGQRNATINAHAGFADAASLDVFGNADAAPPDRVLPMVLLISGERASPTYRPREAHPCK